MVYYRDDSGSHWKVSVMAMSLKAHLKALFLDLWEGWITLSYTLACIWADMVKWLFSPVSWKRLALSPCLVSTDWMLERQLWRRARGAPAAFVSPGTFQALPSNAQDPEVSLIFVLVDFLTGILITRTAPFDDMRNWLEESLLGSE